jgi:hypothetical protein
MIKFLDLKKINDTYSSEMNIAIKKVIDSGWYLLGNEAKNFEKEYSDFLNKDTFLQDAVLPGLALGLAFVGGEALLGLGGAGAPSPSSSSSSSTSFRRSALIDEWCLSRRARSASSWRRSSRS